MQQAYPEAPSIGSNRLVCGTGPSTNKLEGGFHNGTCQYQWESCPPVCVPRVSCVPRLLPVAPGDSLRSAGGSDPVSFRTTASVQGPGAHTTFCAPFEHGVSIFYSPLALLKVNPAGLQSQTPGGLSAQGRNPRTPHYLGRTPCNCNYPPIGGLPAWDTGLD